jgi:hypothetical protein
MTKITRALAVISLIVVLFIAGFTIAESTNGSSHDNGNPPAARATQSGIGSNSSDNGKTGGDETTHIGKPGESKKP